MKLSKFNIYAAGSPEAGKTAVFNTLTRGLVILENDILHRFEKGVDSGLAPSDLRSLHDVGVLVEDGLDEDLFFDVYYNQVRFGNSTLRIVLLTTLNCNFACPYCYEGELTYGKKQMSSETAERVVTWIKARAGEMRASRIKLEYLGGEPLLNIPVIEKVGAELQRCCGEKNIKTEITLISNGYMLTRETAKRLAAAGVENVRVTLDGPEDIHNRSRFLRGDGGKTYSTIISNLLDCKDVISLSLSGCFTKETVDRVPDLLEELIRVGLGPDSIYKVQFAPVSPTFTGGKAAAFDKRCVSTEGSHEIIIKANEELIKRGYGTYADPEFNPCPAVCSADYTINYDGTIYKCPCLVDHLAYEVGDVKEEPRYNAEMVRCLGHNTFENEECRNCSVLPLCLGGCRYVALAKTGEFHSLDCDREGLEALTLENVKRMARMHSTVVPQD